MSAIKPRIIISAQLSDTVKQTELAGNGIDEGASMVGVGSDAVSNFGDVKVSEALIDLDNRASRLVRYDNVINSVSGNWLVLGYATSTWNVLSFDLTVEFRVNSNTRSYVSINGHCATTGNNIRFAGDINGINNLSYTPPVDEIRFVNTNNGTYLVADIKTHTYQWIRIKWRGFSFTSASIPTEPLWINESQFTSTQVKILLKYSAAKFPCPLYSNSIYPDIDNTYGLGSASLRWQIIYGATGAVTSSDERFKAFIENLDDETVNRLIMSLRPVSFEFTDTGKPQEERRTHWGFIAQEVERALYNSGLNLMDFAGITISPETEDYETGEYETIESADENGEPITIQVPIMGKRIVDYRYGLRENEFIAPLVKMVQAQQRQIDQLEMRLESIEKSKAVG